MNKFLLSLMLLASSWAWGAEVLTHDDVAEAKAEMVKLARGEDSFMVPLNKLAPFEMLRAGFVANGFEESHSGLMQLDHEVINKLQHDFLKLYLEDSEAALASLASYSGDQIVDIMMMLEYLNADSNSLEIKKLNNALIDQLKDKLSPEVLQELHQTLGHIPGINLSQTVPGESAEWSPDGSRLWVSFYDDGVNQIQLYQVTADRLVAMSAVVPGWKVGLSPDESKLWVRLADHGVDKIQLYQVTADGLVATGAAVSGEYAGLSPDGSKLWVNFTDNGINKIQLYQVTADRLVVIGAAVTGWKVGLSPDGSKLSVNFTDNGINKIQLYQVTADRLVTMGAAVPGWKADLSPDGSKLWVNFADHGVDKIQIYQVAADRLVAMGAAVSCFEAGDLSPDRSKLWVKLRDHGVLKIQVYQSGVEGLRPVGKPVPGDNAGFSPDGSKLWVGSGGYGADQIQIYQIDIDADRLILVGESIIGRWVGWSPDGTKLLISNASKITVYCDVKSIALTTLGQNFIKGLNLVQQMFLTYILCKSQRTNIPYQIPAELINIWHTLPKVLRARLIATGKVILGKQLLRLGHCEEGSDAAICLLVLNS